MTELAMNTAAILAPTTKSKPQPTGYDLAVKASVDGMRTADQLSIDRAWRTAVSILAGPDSTVLPPHIARAHKGTYNLTRNMAADGGKEIAWTLKLASGLTPIELAKIIVTAACRVLACTEVPSYYNHNNPAYWGEGILSMVQRYGLVAKVEGTKTPKFDIAPGSLAESAVRSLAKTQLIWHMDAPGKADKSPAKWLTATCECGEFRAQIDAEKHSDGHSLPCPFCKKQIHIKAKAPEAVQEVKTSGTRKAKNTYGPDGQPFNA